MGLLLRRGGKNWPIGSLGNDDGDSNENNKNAIGLDWPKNNSARASRLFVHFLAVVALLEVPNVRLKSYGDRAFSVAAPKHWNDIPLDIKLSGSVDVFKSRLKTYLFRLAFN